MTFADELQRKVQEVWLRHLPLMRSRLEVVGRAIEALRRGELTPELSIDAAQGAHKLAGSLGTFGLQTGSDAAVEIEKLFSGDVPLHAADASRAHQHLAELRRAIERK